MIESDERELCIEDNNGENSLLRSDKLFEEKEGNIRVLEVKTAQKRIAIVCGVVGSMTGMCFVGSAYKWYSMIQYGNIERERKKRKELRQKKRTGKGKREGKQ